MKSVLIIFLSFIFFYSSSAQLIVKPPLTKSGSSFAIVVDKETYSRIGEAVDIYRSAVEKDGLSTYILINSWTDPAEIKAKLMELYKKSPPLEGAVFIGDIPIPMIRNAQHLTSAFKMQEDRFPFHRSSVPSDRYYDDFDLQFRFLSRDSADNLLHYYSLLSGSPQKIEREIYTARIKPPVQDDSKYEMIEKYLTRVSQQKSQRNPVNNMLVFSGHGYHSESLTAWADERISLSEQFPQLYKAGNRIKNLNHEMDDRMKDIIFREIQDPSLDIAIFHAHGNPDMQYLLDYPHGVSVPGNIEAVKLYFRSKLRSAKNKEETKEYFKKQYDVTDSWFEGAFTDSVIAADSLLGYSLDIYSADIDGISPQAELIIFDECFNGSFHKENYIAGKYVFGNGTTIAGEANTVNVLQDKWADEHLGLINKGARIGAWHKFRNYLESHIIGDPTYRFTSINEEDINQTLNTRQTDNTFWKKQLVNPDPVIRSLAVEFVYKNSGAAFEKQLVDIYKNDPSVNVRLHTLKCLAEIGRNGFYEVLKLSINDSFELIRRYSAIWMGETGKEEYIPYMLETIVRDESPRVTFNAKNSIAFMNNEKTVEAARFYAENAKDNHSADIIDKSLVSSLKRNRSWLYDEMLYLIKSDTVKLKEKYQQTRTFRNYHFHEAIPQLLTIAKDNSQDEKLRTDIIESLGWFNLYHDKAIIKDACSDIINDSNSPEAVRDEALKTRNRLTTGLNNIFIP
jgi:hypothetical protein